MSRNTFIRQVPKNPALQQQQGIYNSFSLDPGSPGPLRKARASEQEPIKTQQLTNSNKF